MTNSHRSTDLLGPILQRLEAEEERCQCHIHTTILTPGAAKGESLINGTMTLILPQEKNVVDVLVKDERGNQVRVHLDKGATVRLMTQLALAMGHME